ncbi:MAG: hypothetical protein CL840_02970 [Crocinitomicaceae bacterium]|nr:hypothetical protein [Crocinitomicaceae bacterium]
MFHDPIAAIQLYHINNTNNKTHQYMIHNFLVSLLAICTVFSSYSQEFEGRIRYVMDVQFSNEEKEKMGPEKTAQVRQFMKQMYGGGMTIYYKSGRLKIVEHSSDGKKDDVRILNSIDSLVYDTSGRYSKVDWVIESPESSAKIKSTDVKLGKTKERVLGRSCKSLTIGTVRGTQKIYLFDPTIMVKGSMFEAFKEDYWDIICSETNSLPLAIIDRDSKGELIFKASEIEEMKLEDVFFQIPEGASFKDSRESQKEMNDLGEAMEKKNNSTKEVSLFDKYSLSIIGSWNIDEEQSDETMIVFYQFIKTFQTGTVIRFDKAETDMQSIFNSVEQAYKEDNSEIKAQKATRKAKIGWVDNAKTQFYDVKGALGESTMMVTVYPTDTEYVVLVMFLTKTKEIEYKERCFNTIDSFKLK